MMMIYHHHHHHHHHDHRADQTVVFLCCQVPAIEGDNPNTQPCASYREVTKEEEIAQYLRKHFTTGFQVELFNIPFRRYGRRCCLNLTTRCFA